MANLSQEAKVYLEGFNQMPKMHLMEPAEVKAMMAQAPPIEVELEEVAKVEDSRIPVQEGEIKIRIYTPEGDGPFPIILYYHGGGWVLGDLEIADPSCRMLCKQTEHIVVSVDYRLAPEYKFPIPMEDAYAALQWVSENAAEINGDSSKISVCGDSAGGNLSAVIALKSRDENGPKIHSQLLIYPVTDLSYDTPSYKSFAEGFGLDCAMMIWFGSHYINNKGDEANPYIAPLHADDLSQLPPAYVVTAENDVLRDEGIAYAEKLKEAGVKVESKTEKGLVHGYFTTVPLFTGRIQQTISDIGAFLKKLDK